MRTCLLAVTLVLGTTASWGLADESWRVLPLITEGKVDPAWKQIGWGGFVVDGDSLRTECDEKGMGLLLYQREKFGNCRIRVVYRSENAKSNAGVFIRIDHGVLELKENSPPVKRNDQGKLSPEMIDKLKDASERELGAWYPVHHGYEVQICDGADEQHRTGALYSLSKAAALPKPPASLWRTMVITLDGEQVLVDVDGQRISNFDAAKEPPPRKNWTEPKRELKRPQVGYIGLQNHDPGDVVFFREVAIQPLER